MFCMSWGFGSVMNRIGNDWNAIGDWIGIDGISSKRVTRVFFLRSSWDDLSFSCLFFRLSRAMLEVPWSWIPPKVGSSQEAGHGHLQWHHQECFPKTTTGIRRWHRLPMSFPWVSPMETPSCRKKPVAWWLEELEKASVGCSPIKNLKADFNRRPRGKYVTCRFRHKIRWMLRTHNSVVTVPSGNLT